MATQTTHYASVLHILHCIRGTLFHGLHYASHSLLKLRAYPDDEQARDPVDRRSTSYYFFLGLSFSHLKAKNKLLFPDPTLNIKLLLTPPQSLCGQDGYFMILVFLYLKQHLSFMTIRIQFKLYIMIFSIKRTKHIEIDCNFIWKHLFRGALQFKSTSSTAQIEDHFTESHPPNHLYELVSKLSMYGFFSSILNLRGVGGVLK